MTIPTRARRRTLIGSGVFVLITAIAGVMIWRDGRWRGSGEAKNGGPSLSITAVARADETEASRKTAREWVAAGRFDDAFAFYRNLEETQWHAGDCLTLGSALLKRECEMVSVHFTFEMVSVHFKK
jgi:hypothetical protein